MHELRSIPLENLVVRRGNDLPRQDDPAVERLRKSLAENGLLQPITVTPGPDAETFELVSGRRRTEAARRLGWSEIPALVIDAPSDIARAAENTARRGLEPGEMLHVVRDAHERGATGKEIAGALGVTDRLVRYYLAVARHPDLAEQLAAGGSLRHVLALARAREQADAPTQSPSASNVWRRADRAMSRLEREWPQLDEDGRQRLLERVNGLAGEPATAPR